MSRCRICDSSIEKFMSFGKMPIANGFLNPQEFEKEYFFELAPAFCNECKTLQIVDQPKPEMMFHENYAFFSSTSKKMGEHFEKVANHYMTDFVPNPKDGFMVELGSNDGIMLKHVAARGIKCLGVEPSKNVAAIAIQNGVPSISEFFGDVTAEKIKKEHGKADVISSANVMCHIPDLHSVGKGVALLLKDKGVFAFEDPYLGDVIQKTSYDQIYDEHVYLFSVQSVANIFKSHGLEVFHVAPLGTHGGSMRYYLCKKGAHPIRDSVKTQLEVEKRLGLDKPETYLTFKKNCEKSKSDLVSTLKDLKAKGKRVVGYAATSKSTTVLNYCGIGPDLIEYISDTTPIKQNKFSPGMHIPVKSYDEFKAKNPDCAVLFAWNHSAEVFEKEKGFEQGGGKWVLFVPEVKIIP